MVDASTTLADYNLATDPSADLELLNLLARSDHPYVLRALVRHPNADEALVRRIFEKTDVPDVHLAIISSPLVTAELLSRYRGSPLLLERNFRKQLFVDPRTPKAVRRSYFGVWWRGWFSGP